MQNMDFSTFRVLYPARAPAADKIKNAGELVLIPEDSGLQFFAHALDDIRVSSPPRVHGSRGNTYLWVIGQDNVPIALESLDFGKTLETGVIKHTNLTGGKDAHSGGELWFISRTQVVISGSSGRYGAKTEQELMDAVESFKAEGFQVASLGFDDETGFPSTVLVGELKWH